MLYIALSVRKRKNQIMRIVSWNVAGLRACLKRGDLDWITQGKYDMVCLQETKALESEVELPEDIVKAFPYRYWNSCNGWTKKGVGQRKGLSGTAIWSVRKGCRLDTPAFDIEGRITAVDFGDAILVTVYTPNSQSVFSDRCAYRIKVWDGLFREYITELKEQKPTIVCGDFNVANEDRDVYKPEEWRNAAPGFLDNERINFKALLGQGFLDAYRARHPNATRRFTFWDQKLPFLRKCNRGWRIDYFLVPKDMREKVKACAIHSQQAGSDHCPITLCIETGRRRLQVKQP